MDKFFGDFFKKGTPAPLLFIAIIIGCLFLLIFAVILIFQSQSGGEISSITPEPTPTPTVSPSIPQTNNNRKIKEFTISVSRDELSSNTTEEGKIAMCNKGFYSDGMVQYIENNGININDCAFSRFDESNQYSYSCIYGCKRGSGTILGDASWIFEYWNKYEPCSVMDRENKYRYPNSYDSGDNDYPSETPQSDFYHALSIPFHNSDKILRAYLHVDDKSAENFEDEVIRLVIYDKDKKTSILIKDIKTEGGGNWMGILLPYEIIKDDSKVILKGCMGSPGAGGSYAELGYEALSFSNKEINQIADLGAYFYDSFGKVVYVTEGNKTPRYSMPGPSNDAAIHFRNLVQGEDKTILEEEDTSYKITSLYEKIGVLNFEATKYTFSQECPREESAMYCAEKSITNRSIKLP
jgi:hypothetical protein